MRRRNPKQALIDQCKFANSEEELLQLAKELREIFPKGMNHSTKTANRQCVTDLANALLRFEEHYNMEATKEEIIQATKNYNEKMKYSDFRRCSQYFIIKDESLKGNGIVSALATEIEMIRDGEDTGPELNIVNWSDTI